ncbi:hypothetical protein AB4144_25585, partial [Rhizobiaceae sp. 2RAB30]
EMLAELLQIAACHLARHVGGRSEAHPSVSRSLPSSWHGRRLLQGDLPSNMKKDGPRAKNVARMRQLARKTGLGPAYVIRSQAYEGFKVAQLFLSARGAVWAMQCIAPMQMLHCTI